MTADAALVAPHADTGLAAGLAADLTRLTDTHAPTAPAADLLTDAPHPTEDAAALQADPLTTTTVGVQADPANLPTNLGTLALMKALQWMLVP